MRQLITPNPHIPCKPGWCLAYVNEAYDVAKRYGSATAAWNASTTKHRDHTFPAGVWVPLWFHMPTEPNGHVVLRAPDGRIFSTSHPTAHTPTEHPNLAHLINAYARYNPLQYLGWTEDVEGTYVVGAGLAPNSTATEPKEWDEMASQEELYETTVKALWDVLEGPKGQKAIATILEKTRSGGGKRSLFDQGNHTHFLLNSIAAKLGTGADISAADIAAAIPAELAKQVADELGKRLTV